ACDILVLLISSYGHEIECVAFVYGQYRRAPTLKTATGAPVAGEGIKNKTTTGQERTRGRKIISPDYLTITRRTPRRQSQATSSSGFAMRENVRAVVVHEMRLLIAKIDSGSLPQGFEGCQGIDRGESLENPKRSEPR
ncbi:MAG TPA: hypothetical protein VI755_15885, partial [Anaerolineales bacterium]|nr:hypothetical protein [Anaerolineales bacterium]